MWPKEVTARPPSPFKANSFQRILVAEDEPLARQINADILFESGYHVDAAEDGEVAWHALNTNCYDLLVTDHVMPNVTGVQLLKKLHAARMTLPVIMVTGMFPQDEFIRFPWLRPAATLLKPCTREDFLGTVQAVLRTTARTRATTAPLPNRSSQRQPSAA